VFLFGDLAMSASTRARPAYPCRSVITIVFFFHASALVASPGAVPLGFAEAVRLAVERAPDLQARRYRTGAAAEELGRAGALPDPRLMAGIDSLPVGGSGALDMDGDAMTMRKIGLSQDFPSGAERDARRLVAGANLAAARAEAVATGLMVRRAASQAWIGLWAAERERDMLQALQEQTGLAVQQATARLSGGGGSATDVMAAQSAVLDLTNSISAAETRVAEARASLARWLGEVPAAIGAEPPAFARAPVTLDAVLARIEAVGELLAWEARESAAAAQLALARAEKRPDWSVSGGYAQRGGGASDVVWLEASVDLPVFTRNRQDRGIAARRAELEAVQAEREAARRAAAERVRALFANWAGLGEQVLRFEEQLLPLAADRSRTALAAYAGGAPLQAWIDARRDELAARVAYSRTLAQWGQAWAELAYLLPAHDARTEETGR
jgi:outer membrane protein TolC